jgi:hypothetical protein
MTSRNGALERRDIFTSTRIGQWLKFANNPVVFRVVARRHDNINGVFDECYLICQPLDHRAGNYEIEIGHMDKQASKVEFLR